jgi:hypothetical protein
MNRIQNLLTSSPQVAMPIPERHGIDKTPDLLHLYTLRKDLLGHQEIPESLSTRNSLRWTGSQRRIKGKV